MGEPMDRSGRIFMKQGSFDKAFPTLKDAAVEYTEWDGGVKQRSGKFYIRWQGGLMACSNPRCRRGGYEFDMEIHSMVREKANELKIRLCCPGDEGSPKGRRRGQSCTVSVEATIRLTYKEEAAAATGSVAG